MPRRRRRRTQNTGVLILVALVLMLWYFGAIPGLPPIRSVAEPLKELGTLVPAAPQAATLLPQISIANPTTNPTVPASVRPLGPRTRTSGCLSANSLPDARCTPGAVFPDARREQICTPGYSAEVRNVPQPVKDEVYAEYGIASHEPGQYEVDHLVPLELGGSNDMANLWPEPADPAPGFHEKDQVENYLRDQVCSGGMSLEEAQSEIARDWYSVYQGMPK